MNNKIITEKGLLLQKAIAWRARQRRKRKSISLAMHELAKNEEARLSVS